MERGRETTGLKGIDVCLSCKKRHGLGGLNNRPLFLTVLEAGKSKVKGLSDLVPGKDPLNGL